MGLLNLSFGMHLRTLCRVSIVDFDLYKKRSIFPFVRLLILPLSVLLETDA